MVYYNQNSLINRIKDGSDRDLLVHVVKKVELDDVKKEYKKANENYYKKLENLRKNKEKYEILKQENNNLKLMIMNIMKIKSETKGK